MPLINLSTFVHIRRRGCLSTCNWTITAIANNYSSRAASACPHAHLTGIVHDCRRPPLRATTTITCRLLYF
jgi:hypothetical protein